MEMLINKKNSENNLVRSTSETSATLVNTDSTPYSTTPAWNWPHGTWLLLVNKWGVLRTVGS